jgi:hypothetical protein
MLNSTNYNLKEKNLKLGGSQTETYNKTKRDFNKESMKSEE